MSAANIDVVAGGARPAARQPAGWWTFILAFARYFGPYWRSEERWRAWTVLLLLMALTAGQVAVPIAVNLWSRSLFDALQRGSFDRFMPLIGVLFLIIAGNAVVSTAQLMAKRRLQVDWRNWVTTRLVNDWMESGRQYQVIFVPGEHDNPDGRIAEDARIGTEYAVELAQSAFYCLLLLISFVEILWSLSGPGLDFGGFHLRLPGYLVWVAFGYSAIGVSIALLVGRPQVRATDERQTNEANFRFGLVRAREYALSIGLIHGEADERTRFRHLFDHVITAWQHQTRALSIITLYSSSWWMLSQLFPFVVAAPRFLTGGITLGVLMQTAQAFQQTIAALSWPIDHLQMIGDWRASVKRVLDLHEGLDRLTGAMSADDRQHVHVTTGEENALVFEGTAVTDPAGHVELAPFDARIGAGDRVLFTGDLGAASKLFKVVAGLWPWGHGVVHLPKGGPIMFVPQRAYMPFAELREAACYPASSEQHGDVPIRDALRRVGLPHLVDRLDEVQAWEETLAAGEQQRLGFARILLHRPSWIFIEEGTDAVGPAGERELMQLLMHELSAATIMVIAHHPLVDVPHLRRFVIMQRNGVAVVEESAPAEKAG